MFELEKFRAQIDCIDEQIIFLLAKRFEIVKKIWEYKKFQGMSTLQKSRWEQVLKDRKELAKKMWLSSDFIEKLRNEIHKYSLEMQDNI